MKLLGAVLAALMVVGTGADAQQLDFKRATQSGDERLSYRWRDALRGEHAVSFTLTRPEIAEAEASFAEFSMEAMWRRLEAALRDEVKHFGGDVRINVTRSIDGLRWTIYAPDRPTADLLSRRLTQRVDREETAYLARNLRQQVGNRVMVNFAGATEALRGPMRAVAHALNDAAPTANDDRARIALALGFFQEIPYATLEDSERRGGDFLPAPALLAQDRGDCDSKAVALAAVLRTYTPGRKLAVITMPGHAILAADLAPQPNDVTIRSQGWRYVVVEVAGPAMVPVGRVGSQTAKFLRDRREIEIWPLD